MMNVERCDRHRISLEKSRTGQNTLRKVDGKINKDKDKSNDNYNNINLNMKAHASPH